MTSSSDGSSWLSDTGVEKISLAGPMSRCA
jgi:hypothetical protein